MTKTDTLKVVISGAGISGLCLAQCLQRLGIQAKVFERADALRAQGAGIIVQPNAMLVMRWLGLEAKLNAAGHPMGLMAIFDQHGSPLQRAQMGPGESMPELPQGAAIHRGRLLELLEESLAPGTVSYGRGVTGYEQHSDHIDVKLSDGTTEAADVLVGCDGLHSAVRTQLIGPSPARYAGYTTLRGVATMGCSSEHTGEYWGVGRRFGVVPISPTLTYWYTAQDWTPQDEPVTKTQARAMLEGFYGWTDTIDALLEATPDDALIHTDAYDRAPVTRWGEGHITLLGDAAHPMTPNLGQGACQAIEDALILATQLRERLDQEQPIAQALRSYESIRIKRANSFVDQSWRMGQLAHLSQGWMRGLRDQLLSKSPASLNQRMLRKLYVWPPLLDAARHEHRAT